VRNEVIATTNLSRIMTNNRCSWLELRSPLIVCVRATGAWVCVVCLSVCCCFRCYVVCVLWRVLRVASGESRGRRRYIWSKHGICKTRQKEIKNSDSQCGSDCLNEEIKFFSSTFFPSFFPFFFSLFLHRFSPPPSDHFVASHRFHSFFISFS